jgi:hypothetical protein
MKMKTLGKVEKRKEMKNKPPQDFNPRNMKVKFESNPSEMCFSHNNNKKKKR